MRQLGEPYVKSRALGLIFCFLLVGLGGCLGGSKNGGGTGGPELDPSTFAAGDVWDSAIGNDGYRIQGTPTGAATPLGKEAPSASSALLQVIDVGATPGGDQARLVLQVYDGDTEVSAVLKMMEDVAPDVAGGVAHDVAVHGAGAGWDELPTATAYLVATGRAQLKIDGVAVASGNASGDGLHSVIAYVAQGVRDENQALLPAADATDLELHVAFPNTSAGGADGFLYYYFETVHLAKLTDAEKADVDEFLVKADPVNAAPQAVAQVLYDGTAATEATQVESSNVTVTLVGSLSSDPDGKLTSWAWKVFEVDAVSGNFTQTAAYSGETVEHTFKQPGEKVIQLTVRDDRLKTASITAPFYVNRNTTRPSASSLNDQTVGGGVECTDFNCQKFTVGVAHGATRLKVTVRDNDSTVLRDIHIDLYKPGDDPETADPDASGTKAQAPVEVVVDQAKLTKGVYNVQVWYGQGSQTSYIVDFHVRYSPIIP